MPRRVSASTFLAILVCAVVGCEPSKPVAAGPEGIYQQHCARCHARAGEPGGPRIGGSKGPDLKHIKSQPEMTADWLFDYIKDPKSRRPDAKLMPAFGDTLSDEQIRSLAEWLAKK